MSAIKTKNKHFKYLFGPVLSRRLGLSLGIDLVPAKTCPFDCVYCEAGKTLNKTMIRKEFFPLKDVCNEIRIILEKSPKLDYITFSGQGEPTLYSKLGKLVSFIKKSFPQYKICLLTNGVLLGRKNLPEELIGIDLVIPSLDASDENAFRKINRSPANITLKSLIKSIKFFRKKNPAEMWLEIFIVPGINDSPESIANFAKIIREIKPDKIQLNALDRPPTENWVKKPSMLTINNFLKALSPITKTENIIRCKIKKKSAVIEDHESAIVNLVKRRPCTIAELKKIFPDNQKNISKILKNLSDKGIIVFKKVNGKIFVSK